MIPPLGTVLELQEPWTFPLYYESRNKSLGAALGISVEGGKYERWGWGWADTAILPDGTKKPVGDSRGGCQAVMDITLPAGAILRVDRIYIRHGAEAFNSVSFYVKECPGLTTGKKGKGLRFWAKLADVNKMVVEYLS
jgi:hypothetical protein